MAGVGGSHDLTTMTIRELQGRRTEDRGASVHSVQSVQGEVSTPLSASHAHQCTWK